MVKLKVKKLSISLPDNLLKILDDYSKREGISRSKAISRILSIYFKDELAIEEGKYPTVLWKLELMGGLKLRSPRRIGRRFAGEWKVEEF